MNSSAPINFFENESQHKNIVIPLVEVITEDQFSREGKYGGLSLRAAFQREGGNTILQVAVENRSENELSVYFLLIIFLVNGSKAQSERVQAQP